MNTRDLVVALSKIPERRPRIIALAWELLKDGEMDPTLMVQRVDEIQECLKEARDYASFNRRMLSSLQQLFR